MRSGSCESATGRRVRAIRDEGGVGQVAFAGDDGLLVTGSGPEGTVRVWVRGTVPSG
ncbi:hypothetical protein HII36_54945, partial [Nonomuraea sp. NN258]|nr:hypothetical protein [Nonomuraea antri]